MNKKQKSSIILASLASIAVAGSLLAGSTYALFTSESKTNIAVTSGTVDVEATIDGLVTYSGEANSLTGDPTTDADHIKSYEDLGIDNGTFLNGGTATYTNGTLTLDKMMPGDKVTFNINITNNSNVAIKYCIKITSSNDTGLFNGLEVNIPNHSVNGDIVWKSLAYDATNTSIENIEDCSVSLPSNADDNYQDKKCDITISVEAIQGNAKTEDTYYVQSEDELKKSFETVEEGSNIVLSDDISLTYEGANAAGHYDTYLCAKDVTFDLNGHTITVNTNDPKCLAIAASNVTLKNGKIVAGPSSSTTSGKISYPVMVTSGSKNVVLENLDVTGGISIVGNSTATIRNCKITATNYYDVYLEYNNQVTIESGEFTPVTGKVHFNMSFANDKIILNGGTFEDNACYYSGNGTIENNSTVTVTKK